ncbi:MAG: MBL fold metallo-hydrolase [Actinomycetota bacterium]|nr:MBL fold metallo-hydrolase [Actinomycetota bacterium]MDQ2957079.1 MBL fold metallo-hydrolase [Actinomycetota bacterium]
MLLTKFSHACVRITDGGRRLVIDPGMFSEVETALSDVDAVLITHEHADHVDVERLAVAAKANPSLRIWAPKAVVDNLSAQPAFERRLTAVGPGEDFTAGGYPIRTFGGQHALIHSSVPVVANVCYLVEGTIYHPGDSYVVPTASVEVALVPLNAPWAKLAETIDFAVSVRAPRAYGIHDALLGDVGRQAYGGHVARVGAEYGVQFTAWSPGESVEL